LQFRGARACDKPHQLQENSAANYKKLPSSTVVVGLV
jgi:hypothetical protein